MLSFEELVKILTEAGIVIMETNEHPTTFTKFDDALGKFVIYYNPESKLDRVKMLIHELSHILDGDLEAVADPNINDQIWNIASDALINERINFHGDGILDFKKIDWNRSLFESNRKDIYKFIIEREKIIKIRPLCFEGISDPEKLNKAKKERVKIRYRLDKSKEEFKKSMDFDPENIGLIPVPAIKPVDPLKETLTKFLNTISPLNLNPRKSEWRRYPDTRRYGITVFIEKPIITLNIAVFVDVSGSMSSVLEEVIRYLKFYAGVLNYDSYTFSNNIVKYEKNRIARTGGTSLSGINEIYRNYDGIVIISDFEIFDMHRIWISRDYHHRFLLVTFSSNEEAMHRFNNVVLKGRGKTCVIKQTKIK